MFTIIYLSIFIFFYLFKNIFLLHAQNAFKVDIKSHLEIGDLKHPGFYNSPCLIKIQCS